MDKQADRSPGGCARKRQVALATDAADKTRTGAFFGGGRLKYATSRQLRVSRARRQRSGWTGSNRPGDAACCRSTLGPSSRTMSFSPSPLRSPAAMKEATGAPI